MRLDHLLSKETSDIDRGHISNVLRSVQSVKVFTLFNLEGTGKNVPKQTRIPKFGGLAQLGERLPCKQEVTGSIPVLSTKKEVVWANSSAG